MQSEIERLLEIMRTLRDPQQGCPWDLQQEYSTIVPHTLEEAYEVADTIESGDLDALPGELGDLLFQVVFYAQIAAEEGRFGFSEVVEAINEKLVRRHPHIFSDEVVEGVEAQTARWEQLKRQERSGGERAAASMLDGVLQSLPALTRAAKIQRRAAGAGFEWGEQGEALERLEGIFAALRKRLESDTAATAATTESESVEETLGELLFSTVNLCRHLQCDGEGVLRRATRKFENRFRKMEQLASQQGVSLEALSREEMERLWQESQP